MGITVVRRRLFAVAGLTAVAAAAAFDFRARAAGQTHESAAVSRVDDSTLRTLFLEDVDAFDTSLVMLDRAVADTSHDTAAVPRILATFRVARSRYKHIEPILEFYSPALAAALNSRRQEVDDDDQPPPSTLAPSGFPMLESLLFPVVSPAAATEGRKTVRGMRATIVRMQWLAAAMAPSDGQLIELTRLELVRLSTLGIAGFDAPVSGDALVESADAIDGIRRTFTVVGGRRWPHQAAELHALDSTLAAAATHLRAHPDFITSDRLTFLVGYEEPAARALDSLRRAAGVVPITMPRQLRVDAWSPYAPNAFDARVYTPSGAPQPTDALIALGARLFSDPSLSGNGGRSCASCHVPSHAFTDGLVKAASLVPHGVPVARHTPTLLNAAYEPTLFADERAASLEDQVLDVLRSPAEMGSSVEGAADVLARSTSYRVQFARAFGLGKHAENAASTVTPLRVRQALAAYVRSLVALDSRFDRAVRGDTGCLTAEERRGFTLFMGKARCGSCHFAPLFNGATPPLYHASDVEVIGTPVSPDRPASPDPDSGRARIDRIPQHLRAFKTPSLRNIALIAPYMHNGAFKTLDAVIRFYDGGGGAGAGAPIGNQTLAPDSLHLTVRERAAIVAFLGALTDTMSARPR